MTVPYSKADASYMRPIGRTNPERKSGVPKSGPAKMFPVTSCGRRPPAFPRLATSVVADDEAFHAGSAQGEVEVVRGAGLRRYRDGVLRRKQESLCTVARYWHRTRFVAFR